MLIKQVEDLLDEFDFHRVQKAMEALEWNYYDSIDKIPSIGELRRMARGLLNRAYTSPDSPTYFISSGGFEAVRYMYVGDNTKYITLKFVVTDWSKPLC